jgi:hypothetical protein
VEAGIGKAGGLHTKIHRWAIGAPTTPHEIGAPETAGEPFNPLFPALFKQWLIYEQSAPRNCT